MRKKKKKISARYIAGMLMIAGIVHIVQTCTNEAEPEGKKPESGVVRSEQAQQRNMEKERVEAKEAANPEEAVEHSQEGGKSKTEETRRSCCDLLYDLLQIREKPDFAVYGFTTGGPYHTWMSQALDLQRTARKYFKSRYISPELSSAPAMILQCGMEYARTKGNDTEYTKNHLPGLKKVIGYEKYQKQKNETVSK